MQVSVSERQFSDSSGNGPCNETAVPARSLQAVDRRPLILCFMPDRELMTAVVASLPKKGQARHRDDRLFLAATVML